PSGRGSSSRNTGHSGGSSQSSQNHAHLLASHNCGLLASMSQPARNTRAPTPATHGPSVRTSQPLAVTTSPRPYSPAGPTSTATPATHGPSVPTSQPPAVTASPRPYSPTGTTCTATPSARACSSSGAASSTPARNL